MFTDYYAAFSNERDKSLDPAKDRSYNVEKLKLLTAYYSQFHGSLAQEKLTLVKQAQKKFSTEATYKKYRLEYIEYKLMPYIEDTNKKNKLPKNKYTYLLRRKAAGSGISEPEVEELLKKKGITLGSPSGTTPDDKPDPEPKKLKVEQDWERRRKGEHALELERERNRGRILERQLKRPRLLQRILGRGPKPKRFPANKERNPDSVPDTILRQRFKSKKEKDFDDDNSHGDYVDCTVFLPPKTKSGTAILIQVFAHLIEKSQEAEKIAKEFDEDAVRRGYTSLSTVIEKGTELTFQLSIHNITVEDPVQKLIWQGRTESVEFEVNISSAHPAGNLIGKLIISQKSIPIGHIRFKIEVQERQVSSMEPDKAHPTGDSTHYKNAFISYASIDRSEVLRRVQMLSATRIKYFQDILNLEPGDRWAQQIYKHIDDADVFFLFWSDAASKSEWVLKEALYALKRKSGDDNNPPEIVPILLEKPIPNPPEELKDIHFNDKIIYFIDN